MHKRALQEAQTPAKLKRNRSLAANSQLSMEEKKRKIVRNLRRLESLGLVDSAHQYQELINELAKVCWGLSWEVTSLNRPRSRSGAVRKLGLGYIGFLGWSLSSRTFATSGVTGSSAKGSS